VSSAEFVDSNGVHDLSSVKLGTVLDTLFFLNSEHLERLIAADVLSSSLTVVQVIHLMYACRTHALTVLCF
jgi:hypothetical protein